MFSSSSWAKGTAPPLVEGTVVDARREADEPPDSDLAWTLSMIILIVDVLALLAVILLPLFVILVVLLLLITFLGLAGIMSPFMYFGLGALLSFIPRPGQRGGDRVPVMYLRVQDGTGAEFDIRMKGFLKSGSVTQSDVLRVWGQRKRGVIMLDRALNVRTGAWVEIQKKPGKAVLAGLALVNLLLLAALCSNTQ